MGILTAVVTRQPFLVTVAAFPLTLLFFDVVGSEPPAVEMEVDVGHTSVPETTMVEFVISIGSSKSDTIEVVVAALGSGRLSRVDGHDVDDRAADTAHPVSVVAGETATISVEVECVRWGRAGLGIVALERSSPAGLVRWVAASPRSLESWLWVRPASPPGRARLGVWRTARRPGLHTSSHSGTGVEYHSSRPFMPGDRWRDVDHRTSARRGGTWTSVRHGEFARDVVVVVDLIDEGEDPTDPSPTLADQAVRAADIVIRDHLADKDRVGMLLLAGPRRWIVPRDGNRQRQRLVAALVRSKPRQGGSLHRRIDLGRHIRPGTSVLVISPLFDQVVVDACLDVRRAGHDVSVLRVGADLVRPGLESSDPIDKDATVLRLITEAAWEDRLRAAGVAVTSTGSDDDLIHRVETALETHRRQLQRRARR